MITLSAIDPSSLSPILCVLAHRTREMEIASKRFVTRLLDDERHLYFWFSDQLICFVRYHVCDLRDCHRSTFSCHTLATLQCADKCSTTYSQVSSFRSAE